jgi:hypothetical protein
MFVNVRTDVRLALALFALAAGCGGSWATLPAPTDARGYPAPASLPAHEVDTDHARDALAAPGVVFDAGRASGPAVSVRAPGVEPDGVITVVHAPDGRWRHPGAGGAPLDLVAISEARGLQRVVTERGGTVCQATCNGAGRRDLCGTLGRPAACLDLARYLPAGRVRRAVAFERDGIEVLWVPVDETGAPDTRRHGLALRAARGGPARIARLEIGESREAHEPAHDGCAGH